LLKESNSEENDNINRKIIDVLHIEIRRLSDKGRAIDKNFHSVTTHSQANTTFSTTRRNHKAKLIFTFTRTANSQYKINIITTLSDQANTDDNNFSTAESTAFAQENLQDVSSCMSIDEIKTDCNESSSVKNPPGIFHQIIDSDDS